MDLLTLFHLRKVFSLLNSCLVKYVSFSVSSPREAEENGSLQKTFNDC